MLGSITAIFGCQLAGELLVVALGLPVPGPVAGMLILLIGLIVRGSIPPSMATVGDALLGNFSLLFVPAGVGVMLHVGLLRQEWLAISVSIVLSTLVTIAATALLMRRMSQGSDQARVRS